jgi:hypothetical protein
VVAIAHGDDKPHRFAVITVCEMLVMTAKGRAKGRAKGI